MRILIPGWNAEQSFETACMHEFRKLGHDVIVVENKPARWWLGNRSWWSMGRGARFFSDFVSSFELYMAARKFRPDLIFMTKGENLRAEVFTILKKKASSKLAIWYVDNPFHANVTSYQALRHIQKSDLYFIWAQYLIDPIYSAGAQRVEFLPFAFDPGSHPSKAEKFNPDPKWKSDVCFVGTWDRERESALLPLAGQNFDLAVYGQGWQSNLPQSSALRKHVRSGSIWLGDVSKAFHGAKLVLNFLRQHNWKGHNFRTMEATGIGGGALLTPYTDDQAKMLFCEGEEIFCYHGETPSSDLIQSLLANPEKLKSAARCAQKRVFREHLLTHRIQKILQVLSKN